MKHFIHLIIGIAFAILPASAQVSGAERDMFAYRFEDASRYLTEEHRQGKADHSLELGRLHYMSRSYAEAVRYLKEAYQRGRFASPSDYFMLADAMKRQQLTGEARMMTDSAQVLTGSELLEPVSVQLPNGQVVASAQVSRMDWSTADNEIMPWLLDNTLFFASDRAGAHNLNQQQALNEAPYYELYFQDAQGKIRSAAKYKRENKDNTILQYWKSELVRYHQTPPCILGDSMIIISGNKGEKVKNGDWKVYPASLFMIRKTANGKWGKPEKTGFSREGFDYLHPTFDSIGRYMYFSSNQPGGKGSFDIWRSQWSNGAWSEPENVYLINTQFREVFPSVTGENAFYFASDGYDGLGGLDIMLKVDAHVVQMPAPLNSHMDDFSMVQVSDSTGYFNSDRFSSPASDDIYAYTIYKSFGRSHILSISAYVQDDRTRKPLKDVEIYIINKKDSTEKYTYKTNSEGIIKNNVKTFYIADTAMYKVTISKFGYLTRSGNFSLLLDEDFEININEMLKRDSAWLTFNDEEKQHTFMGTASDINMDKMAVQNQPGNGNGHTGNGNINTDLELTEAKFGMDINSYLQLKPIYFDFNLWDITPAAMEELDKVYRFMVANPRVSLELLAYTDSRGTFAWNIDLSKNRARATAKYLTDKGIDPDRLMYHGKGETSILNRCVDDVECSEEEHAVNRRTEFKIIKY